MERFPDKARVCFVGDSITCDNTYVAHIAACYREQFPEAMVEFYNCGISGARLSTVLAAFDEDIAPIAPTHIVLMIGINDSDRWHLDNKKSDYYDQMKAAFELYQERLKNFCERVKSICAKLIICTPMPYDEYLESENQPLKGGAALMLGYANFLKGFSGEMGYPLCDYHSYITREITLSTSPLYNPDRIHPNALGHYYMAKCFLEFQGIKIAEEKELSERILPWHKAICALRAIITAESLIVNDAFSKNDDERMSAILEFVEKPTTDDEYIIQLGKAYSENKKNQAMNFEFVKNFMKGDKL